MLKHIQHIAQYGDDIIAGSGVATIVDHSMNPDGSLGERIAVAVITAVIIPFFKDLSNLLIEKLRSRKVAKNHKEEEPQKDKQNG